MAWIFLAVSLVGAWLTYNAYRPRYAGGRRAAISFFTGWLTTELALHHIAWQVLATLFFLRAGALHAWPGKLGLLITFASWVGLWRCFERAREAEAVVEHALRSGLGADYGEKILPDVRARFSPAIDWRQILLPFPMRHPEVERLRDITYARAAGLNLKLDVYRHRAHPT